MPTEREAEVKVKTVIDTFGNVEAFYCSCHANISKGGDTATVGELVA